MNMEKLINFSDWLWSGPLIAIILFGGIYISFRLKFLQFFKLPLIIKGVKKDAKSGNNGEGNISPLQTAFTAIGSTLGAGNIMGMAIAVSMGGLGAIFWMMIFGIFALLLKYSEVVLAIKHREKNMFGDFVGGPAYYLKKTAIPILGAAYALTHAIQCLPSIGTQSMSVVQSAETINIPAVVTGFVIFGIMFITVIGGVKRIANVMDVIVPFMAVAYFVLSWIIILYNYKNIPIVLVKMVEGAFSAPAAFGGLAGGGVAMTLRSGFARGIYSSEAGIGTTSIAYAAATTDYPARQALWGLVEVGTSTFLMCLTSALLVSVTGVYEKIDYLKAASMPAIAFQEFYGSTFGGVAMTSIVILFVLSTVIVEALMGQREVEYLFGSKVGNLARYLYVIAVLIGVYLPLDHIVSLLDLSMAFLVVLNMFALITMVKDVVNETDIFFKVLKKEVEGTNDDNPTVEAK